MIGITRRDFIKAAALVGGGRAVAAAPAVAGMMGGGGGMTGGGTAPSVIDPPLGPPFADPVPAVDLSDAPGVVEVALEARRATVDVNGTAAQLLTYNGEFPAPTIRCRTGDLLRVRLTNSLPGGGVTNMLGHPKYNTNLHTHGLHVSPDNNYNADGTFRSYSDNMMVELLPGQEALYEYDLTLHKPGNLNFYHPHLHGSVADQMWGGMAGALVVEDEPGVLGPYETHLMVLKDVSLSGSEPVPHSSMMDYMRGLEGQTVMVNGQVNPELMVAPQQVQRWRVVNASNARFYRLSLQGHTMYLAGTEGGLLAEPKALTELLLSPGERADLLVKATGTPGSSYKLYSLPYSRQGNMGGQQVTLATLRYKGKKEALPQALPTSLDPSAVRLVPGSPDVPIAKTVSMQLSMGQGAGYINGYTFTSHESAFHTMSKTGTYEIWEISNASGMDHPFHQHVNHVQVLSISGGDAGYRGLWTTLPAWKDTVIVPKWGSVRLLVPVMDYEGMAMMHCHIIEHEDIGMMGVWHIMKGMDM